MKQGDRVPGLIGWEFHGDPPRDLPGLEIVAQGLAFQGGEASGAVDGHDLSRAQGELRVQRLDDLLVSGPQHAAGPHTAWSHWSRPHGPDPRVQQITLNLLRRAGCLP